ncbi:MAG TPA: cation-transporting P-type ATPase [Actinomycetota bacterium]|nr:cation-transporting P-type ATPase [Actinomycetota bacterium]
MGAGRRVDAGAEAAGLGVDPAVGLTEAEARARLRRHGPNELPPPPRVPWPIRLLRLLGEPMSVLLIAAAAVDAFGLREPVDASAILAIVALNAAIAFLQEGKAAEALEALRRMESPRARVLRDGVVREVPARELVPGDVVLLAAGDRVPADLRLVEATLLEVDESLLTGESLPVTKSPGAPEGVGLSERPATAFSGTVVTRGAGRGIVVATGAGTELGRIAAHLGAPEAMTPLQRELRGLTLRLGAIAVAVAAGVFALIAVRTGLSGEGLQRAFLAGVALAVAAVPEGLATVVTVALALGVRRMAARGAIVRRLAAVETLGAATAILTDKTGTLTENRMRLEAAATADLPPGPFGALPPRARAAAARVAALCNDAALDPPSGDPLDVALLEAVGSEEVRRLRASHALLGALPFEAGRRRMTVAVRGPDGAVALLVKGAPEVVLDLCSRAATAAGEAPLGPGERLRLAGLVDELAATGMRTLALADRPLPGPPADLEEAERELRFVALVGLRDPVRPQARAAVEEARRAGIRLAMVTGDHAGTAAAIAREVGLLEGEGGVRTGAELRAAGLPEDPLAVPVYARVDPDQKLALVEALQARGHVVAVTGDGVNDAPALRRAEIGVAMGRRGTDVAREAADMVITDDDLATIVHAVREGRGIYDNIRKVVEYLVGGNLSEIAVVVGALVLFPALGVPLLPLQLLWINLLTDGPPAIALAVDAIDPRVMERPPRPRGERLLSGRRLLVLVRRAALMAGAPLGALAVARFAWGEPWAHARALAFTVLVVAHLLYAFAVRRPPGDPPSLRRLASNPWLLAGVGAGLALQLGAIVWPPARGVLGTAPLTPREWGLVLAGGLLPVSLMLLEGASRRRARG